MAPAPGVPSVSDGSEQRAQLRRRWWILLPATFITYSLAYLDRANYGFGAAAGLAATLHIDGNRAALLGALFFLGYFAFQIPGASYARRRSATRLIFFALLAWGILASLTGVLRSFWLLAADRLLLGVAESFVLPAMLILLTEWFTQAERSRANTLLLLGNPVTVLWMSALTGYVIHAVGWQMAFVLEGLPAVVWAFLWLRIVRDRPAHAPWLSAAAALSLTQQLQQEQSSLPAVPNIAAAFRRPVVLLISTQYFFWSLAVYGFVLWLPTLIHNGAHNSLRATGLLGAVPYLLAIVLMWLAARAADRTLRRKRCICAFLALSSFALLACAALIGRGFYPAYGFLILAGGAMYAPYGPFFAIIPDILPANVAGEVMALINSCGALGGFFGTWLVGLLQAATGDPRSGILLMACSLLLSALLTLALRESHPPLHPENIS